MKIHEQRSSDMQHLADRLKGQRTAMFTLRDSRGQIGGRPLTVLEMDRDGALWALVSKHAMKPHFASGAQPANFAFVDADNGLYVSIAGQAELVDEAERKRELWTAVARPWFSGPDDADLTLLCLSPQRAEVWDGPDSAVVRVLALAASVVAGKEIGLGEHEVVVPAGQSASLPLNVPA